MKLVDLTGTRFNRWLVVGRAPNTKQGQARWLCRCDCGTERIIKSIVIRRSISKSCGCFKLEELVKRSTTHGHATNGLSPTYMSWASMVSRCTDPNSHTYDRYGGRGITVCDRWLQFHHFLADMGERPVGTSIDRIDNDKGYESANCRWATTHQQARNTRGNYRITINGLTRCVSEWAEIRGIRAMLIWDRLAAGWSHENAVMRPIAVKHRTKRG